MHDPDLDAIPWAKDAVVLVPISTCRPWGPWATLGWTALVLVAMIVIQNLVAIAFIVAWMASGHDLKAADLSSNGNLMAAAALVSTPPVLGFVYLLVRLRRCLARDYLALLRPRPRPVFLSLAGLAVLLAASDGLSYGLGRPIVPEVMVTAYRTSWPPLLALAVLVAAPLGEETIMRGFLFRGLATSRWGPTAAVVVSALLWSVIHVQYDFYGIATVFAMGLYLGFVRQRTGSVPLTVLLHSVANAVATAEVVVQVEWLSR